MDPGSAAAATAMPLWMTATASSSCNVILAIDC